MILADAYVIIRFTDNSVSITGWGWWFFIVIGCCISSTYRGGK